AGPLVAEFPVHGVPTPGRAGAADH
ncbi:MAG: hypothetical protein AVDCRST_MAG73-2683, partial [uncultured Thermomicrobiales bacterium]